MAKIIGIDLGTTNSCIAVMEGEKPVVIANAEGTRTTPSVIAFNKKKDLLIGEIAKRQAILNPINTFHSIKRFIGRDFAELDTEVKDLSFGIKKDESRIKIDCPILEKSFSPEEISARILQKLVKDACEYLGEPVTKAVVTVPAYFNDSQRQATKDAGKIAGVEIVRIITEPVAAALAYGLNTAKDQKVLVFDLGGGTFDVSVLHIYDDNVFEVLSTSGDTHLGGEDFDKLIVNYIANYFRAIEGIDLRQDKQSLQRLTEAAEKAKIELSYASASEISLPFITANNDGPKHLEISITRDQFENLSEPLLRRCFIAVEQALNDAELASPSEIDEILFVGGSTRMPAVEEMIVNKLCKKPNKTVNPDEIVALGAATQAAFLEGKMNVLVMDVTPLSLGIRTESDRVSVLIHKNKTIPTKVTKTFTTASDNQTSVKITIVQGENKYAKDNKCLGVFKLSGLKPAPQGQTKIQVTFDVDANGILSVKAIDEYTGKEQSIIISDASRLEASEIEQINKNTSKETNKFNHTAALEPLVGSELLNKIKELGDVSKTFMARECGYVSKQTDGSEKILWTTFYEALLVAKRIKKDNFETERINHAAEPLEPLVGSELLNKIKELGDVSKTFMAKECGYVSKQTDGSEKILWTSFCEALVNAKGGGNDIEENYQDADLQLAPDRKILENDKDLINAIKIIPYLEMKGSSVRLPRPHKEEDLIARRTCPSYNHLFEGLEGENILKIGLDYNSSLGTMIKNYTEELIERLDKMFGDWFNDNKSFWSKYSHYSYSDNLAKVMTLFDGANGFDYSYHHLNFNIEENMLVIKLSIGNKDVNQNPTDPDFNTYEFKDAGIELLADEIAFEKIDDSIVQQKTNSLGSKTNYNIHFAETMNATFKLVDRLVIDDIKFDQRIYSAYSAEYRDDFIVPLQKSWFESVFALKGSAYMSLKYEVFSDFFSDNINKITDRIMEYCSNPSWDAEDELPGHIDGLLLGIQELYPLCKYLSISEQDVLKLLFTNDGIEIDSVTINPELIRCVEGFESGEINEDEFKDEVNEFDVKNPMFEIELHLMMQSYLDYDNLTEKLEEKFNNKIPGIDNIESAEYAKFLQLCNSFVASLVKEFIPHNK